MSVDKKNKKNKIFRNFKNKYKFVIMQDDTFEEKLSFRLSRMNVFVIGGISVIILIIATIFIIAFTPLREYIPGYANVNMDKKVRELALTTDSLIANIRQKNLYINNIKNIIEGKDIIDSVQQDIKINKNYDTISLSKSREDSLLRKEIENIDQYNQYNLSANEESGSSIYSIKDFLFFTPLKGIITNNFNPKDKHYGVDVVAGKNSAIKATLDGVVIFSVWTLNTGYSIAIQHQNNIISVYKHNSALLKKEGDFVKAGEVIAILGSSGELSTGPHLHFELWYNGMPVNPVDYITF
jgi:murein DD-endopeptidase MepM/ murein hydrolase activator NlpD